MRRYSPCPRRHNRRWQMTPWGWQRCYQAVFMRVLSARWRKRQRAGV